MMRKMKADKINGMVIIFIDKLRTAARVTRERSTRKDKNIKHMSKLRVNSFMESNLNSCIDDSESPLTKEVELKDITKGRLYSLSRGEQS